MGLIKWFTNLMDRYNPGMLIVLGLLLLFTIPTLPFLESKTWQYFSRLILGVICLFVGAASKEERRRKKKNEQN